MSKALTSVQKAWASRKEFVKTLREEGTDCFRLFNPGEGIQGWVLEQYGETVVAQLHLGKCTLPFLERKQIAEWMIENTGARSVYEKEFAPDRSHQKPEARVFQPLAGKATEPEIRVWEGGCQFLIQPFEGFSTGLFLDQRENRKVMALGTEGLSVLNLFSYTCGFSLYAAKAGASTVSVDISEKYLDWGKRNFEANGIAPSKHEFFSTDSEKFLEGTIRRGRKFDRVIIDPPTFSRSKKFGTFQVEKALGNLLKKASEVLVPGGELFFSTNQSTLGKSHITGVAKKEWHGRKHRFLDLPASPMDFQGAENLPVAIRVRF